MERTRVYLITEYPFYAAMLNQSVFSWTQRIKTAAVGLNSIGNVMLLVNKEYFYSLSDAHRAGLLMHEMLHLAMQHLLRGKDLDNKLANIAMDIAINQYIPAELLPPGALLPALYNLTPNKSFEHYYIELQKRKVDPQEQTLDEHNWDSPLNTDEELDGSSEFPADAQLSEEMKEEVIKRIVENAVAESEQSKPGSVPIQISEELEKRQIRKSKINWQQKLRNYIGKRYGNEYESTRNRPNRRLGLGAPGTKRVDAPKVLIAIDESGSVSDNMVMDLISEVKWILNIIADKTEVVFFDTEIVKSIMLDKLREVPKRVASGGTNFQAVINYANTKHPDLLIMLTDGECDAPTNYKYRVLWALVGKDKADHLEGVKIRL